MKTKEALASALILAVWDRALRVLGRCSILLLLEILPGGLSHAQSVQLPQLIDGSKTPNLIPDALAYRLVFYSMRVQRTAPQDLYAKESHKQELKFNTIGLSRSDNAILKSQLLTFDIEIEAWEKKAAAGDPTATPASREDIVAKMRDQLAEQLSPLGASRLDAFVSREKSRMKAWW